jgi:hypothetical protein
MEYGMLATALYVLFAVTLMVLGNVKLNDTNGNSWAWVVFAGVMVGTAGLFVSAIPCMVRL